MNGTAETRSAADEPLEHPTGKGVSAHPGARTPAPTLAPTPAQTHGQPKRSAAWSAPSGTPVPAAPHRQPPRDLAGRLADVDRRISEAGLPFDSLRTGIEWWYRPFIDPRTWTALGWLFVGLIWGTLTFVLVVVVVAVVFALSLIGVGLLLIVPAFGLVNGLANLERLRAGWVGEVIPAPPLQRSVGQGPIEVVRVRLGDAARWRQVLFFALIGVAWPVFFALGFAPWGFLVSNVFGADFDPTSFSFGGLLVAAVFAGLAPRITSGVVWVARSFTATLLGPSDNAELRERVTELSGQRQQILDAVGEERRRIERNLHDGVQQQLVALGIDIGRASARLDSDPEGARELLDDARDKVRGSIGELRLIGRGLHPAVLEDRGLDAALSAVVAAAPIPIAVDVTSQARLPEDIASTAYYIANESIANVLKHAGARVASIRLEDDRLDDGRLAVRLTIHDDGRGGADPSRGSGLAGIRARVEGVDGTLRVSSPVGGPTTLVAVLPKDRTSHAG